MASEMESTPLYNSRIVDAYLRYVRNHYPQIDLQRLLSQSDIQPHELKDEGHWFSQAQLNALYQLLVKTTGNQNLAREVGRAAPSSQSMGAMRHYLLSLAGPQRVFARVGQASRHFTRSSDYRSKQLQEHKVEVTVTPRTTAQEKPFQCQNRMGYFEAMITMFNQQVPDISHPECLFRGDPCCRYVLSWKPGRSDRWRKLRNRLMLAGGLTTLGILPAFPIVALACLLPATLVTAAFLSLVCGAIERSQLQQSFYSLQQSTEGLANQIDRNYKKSRITEEIGRILGNRTATDTHLQQVMNSLSRHLGFDRGMIVLENPTAEKLIYRAGFGYQPAEQKILAGELLSLPLTDPTHPFAPLMAEQTPLMVNNVHAFHNVREYNIVRLFRKLHAGTFLVCPIISNERVTGFLAMDMKPGGRPLVQSDLNLLQGIAPLLGISLHNDELLRSRSDQFQSVLQVLAASIDARDFLTAGHSEMVTEYAVGICKEMELDEESTEMIRIAAMLHDYGKIAVPDFILKKDGPLTAEETSLVQTHSAKSQEILERIPFEGLFRQIPEVVGAHHEKLDGSGYPRGLKGENIPLGARIIAVADFFEAITAKRHYREPMPYPEALQLLAEESLIHFDKAVVDAFFRFFSKSKLCLVGCGTDPNQTKLRQRKTRIPYRTQVSCQVENHTIAGTATNLSMGGIYIASSNELQEGSEADIIFALPDAPAKLVKARGRVAWINQSDEPKVSSLPTGFGFEFISMEDDTSKAVQNFVSRAVLREQALNHSASLH